MKGVEIWFNPRPALSLIPPPSRWALLFIRCDPSKTRTRGPSRIIPLSFPRSMRDQKHPSTNQAGTGGSSGATKPRSAPSRYTPPPNPGPLFCPPTNHQRFFRVFDSVDLFSFHSSDGAMPYVPRSRALISVLACSRLHAMTEPVFCEMPAFGEGACANRGLSELDQLSMYT